MLITYRGDDEVIVTTDELEKAMLKEWFIEGGRDTNDYDREVCNDEAVTITARLNVL